MNHQPSALLPTLSQFTLTRKRLLLLIIPAFLTVFLLIALGGGREAIDALAGVNLGWIGLGLLIHYSGFAVRGLRWQQLLRSLGYPLSWRYSMALLLSGWFVSALLPARAGDLLRVGVLRLEGRTHEPVPVAESLGSIVLERVLDLLALVLLGTAIGFAVLRTQLPDWVLVAYGISVGGLLTAGVVLLVAPILLHWMESWLAHLLWQKIIGFAMEVVGALRSLLRQPIVALLVVLESLYIWLCDALLMWLVLKALGVTVGLGSIAFVALTVDIFAAIPITPGGIGQIEAANVALLALLSLPSFNIAAAVLLNRTISYWSFLIVSGIVTFAAGIGQLVMQGKGEEERQGDSRSEI